MTGRTHLLAVALVLALVPVVAAQSTRVTGTVTYRERIALPPTAVAVVTLEDVSRAGAPGTVVATARIEHPSQVPIKFTLDYDAMAINAASRYGIRARIVEGRTVLFQSTDPVLVLTQGRGATADLVLEKVGTAKPRPAPAQPAPPLPPNPATNLPATFVGTVPCADCPGIRYHLNLYADDSFLLQRTHLGKETTVDEIGSYALSSDRKVIVLKGRQDTPEWFAVASPGVLRKLDASGSPMSSTQPNELRRASMFQHVDVRTPMRGTYTYMADAASFVECSTGRRLPVAPEGANLALRSGYEKARTSPGAPVFLEVEGRMVIRPRMEGAGGAPSLVVEKVGRWLPKESCAPRFASMPLGTTTWKLVEVGGKPVPASSDPRREPNLVFDEASRTFSGTGGCNRLVGQYTIDQATITLEASGTLMACRSEGPIEAAVMAAFKATKTYRIAGRTLELMDARGVRLARFDARVASGITVR